jgi:hypothetical protein
MCSSFAYAPGTAIHPENKLGPLLPEFISNFLAWQKQESPLRLYCTRTTGKPAGNHAAHILVVPQAHTYHSWVLCGTTHYGFREQSLDTKEIKHRIAIERDITQKADCIISTSPYEKEIEKHYSAKMTKCALCRVASTSSAFIPSIARSRVKNWCPGR